MVVTSITLRCTRNDGGDAAAWFASDDGSVDFTKFSELPVIDSMDCGTNDELMDLSEDGRRSPGFGDIGRTYGSGIAATSPDEEEEDATAAAAGAGGAGTFIGGGGIIPLL